MIKLRDHYFISWLKVVKGYNIIIDDSGIFVDINNTEYSEVLQEYETTLKPILKEIRQFVKQLASLPPNSASERK